MGAKVAANDPLLLSRESRSEVQALIGLFSGIGCGIRRSSKPAPNFARCDPPCDRWGDQDPFVYQTSPQQ